MDSIGTVGVSVVRTLRTKAASPAMRSSTPALLAKREADGLPVMFDRECDLDLPRSVFCSWKEDDKPREAVRALTAPERAKLEARANALADALQPFGEVDANSAKASIAAMCSGFRAMRQQGDDVDSTTEITLVVLRNFPAWAIARACLKIAQGRARLDRRFAPNDADIFTVVGQVVQPYEASLGQARALLAAPVLQTPSPPRAQHSRAPSGRLAPITPWSPERSKLIVDDLAARKARNEQSADTKRIADGMD